MTNVDNNYEFLKEVSQSNIAKVKANFQFKFNGYTTLYAVDTYDVLEFCFPLIFNSESSSNSQLDISNFLSYQNFFFEYPTKPILFNEYKVELFSFWYKLRKNVAEFSNYESLKNEMIKQYKKLETDKDKIIFIESNIGMLLAIAFGALSKTPVDRYKTLVSDRFQIDSLQLENKEDQRIIEDIFLETVPKKELVNKAFDEFCEEQKFTLLRKSEEEKVVYLENTYRDIKVFDRIVNINRALNSEYNKSRLKGKYNILYLSSAKKKTDIIERCYRDYLPSYIDIASDSIHRTNIEVYLFQLLNLGDSVEQKEKTISFLKQFEKVSQAYVNNSEKIEKYKEIFTGGRTDLNVRMIEPTKDIDDIFLKYHSIREYRKKIDLGIQKLKHTGNDTDLLEEFTKVLDQASNSRSKVALTDLEKSFKEYNLSIDIKKEIVANLNNLTNRKIADLRIQGEARKDFIRSRIQSFPILLFHRKKESREVQKVFYEIIKPGTPDNVALRNLIHNPGQLLYSFSTFEKRIFFLLIQYLFDPDLKEESIISELDALLELNKKSFAVLDLAGQTSGHVNVFFKENESLKNELLYFKTWVLRRNNQQDAAIQIIDQEESVSGAVDARLYHSRALCYKNKYYHERSIQSADVLSQYLNYALSDFEMSEKIYHNNLKADNSTILLPEVLVAISNSIIDTFTKLYLLNGDRYSDSIPLCRTRLNELKQKINKVGYQINNYPAFSHTEIDLEFCEALLAFSNNDIIQAQFKIQKANSLAEKIVQSHELSGHEPFSQSVANVRKFANFLFRRSKDLNRG